MADVHSAEDVIDKRARAAYLAMRLGVAFAFLYPPIHAFFEPYTWIGYFPTFVQSAAEGAGVSDLVLLHTFGVVEVVIALWILSGWKIYWPSLLGAAILIAIVLFNLHEFPILFRDLSVAALALALALMNVPKRV